MGSSAAYWSRAPAASPASPVQRARLARAARVSGCSGPKTRSRMGSSAAYWSRAPAASPASPVQRARLARAARVSGCSGPRTRSRTGSSAANWSRAPAASPASPGPLGEVRADGQGIRVLGAQDPLAMGSSAADRRGPRPHPPPARSRRRGLPRGQGVRVLRAEDLLDDRQQRRGQVARPGHIPRPPGPLGEVGAGGQGVRVLGARHLRPYLQHPMREVPGRRVVSAVPKIGDELPQAAAVVREGGPCVGQQCSIRGPRYSGTAGLRAARPRSPSRWLAAMRRRSRRASGQG